MSGFRWCLLIVAMAGCGVTEPSDDPLSEPIDLTRASTLRPRLAAPGRLEVRSPEAPDTVVAITVDDDDTFTLVSSDDDLRSLAEEVAGLVSVGLCPADLGELGTLQALCAVVEVGAEIAVEVTATPDATGDAVTWSELDRFDAGCVATATPETLRCTIAAEVTLSPLATFEAPPPPPPPLVGNCTSVARTFGTVDVVEAWGDQLLVGGNDVPGIGQSYDGLVRFDADGIVESCVAGPGGLDDEVWSVVADSQGRLYVGGDFNSWNGDTDCTNLARLLPDGALDRDFCLALDEPLGRALLVIDEPILYVVGRREVVAVDITTDTVVATSPQMSIGGPNTPLDVALADDTLYLAGSISSFGDETYEGLAALDATTLQPKPVPLSFEFDPVTIEVVGDQLWLGGTFSTVNGQPRENVAVVDEATLTLEPTTVEVSSLNARVVDLAASPDGVWIAGRFEQVNGEDRESLALVSRDGTLLDETYPIGMTDEFDDLFVSQVIEDNGVLTVLGGFDRVGTTPQRNLASFERSNGSLLDTAGVFTTFDDVARLFATPAALWVWAPGGTEVESTTSGYGVYDPVARTFEPLDLQADSTINDLWLDGDVAYLWGFFDNVLGQPRERFAAVDLSTGELVPWSVDLGLLPTVFDVSFGPDTIYVVGDRRDENTFETVPIFRVLDKTTGLDVPGIAPTIGEYVTKVVPHGDDLILCGDPVTVNGEPRSGLAWISAIDGSLRDTTASLQAPCFDVVLDGDTLFAYAPTSSTVSGLPSDDALFAIDAATGALANWQPGLTPSVFGLEAADGAVYAAGLGFPFGFSSLVAFDATTGAQLPWDPEYRGWGITVVSASDKIVFTTSEGELHVVDPPN